MTSRRMYLQLSSKMMKLVPRYSSVRQYCLHHRKRLVYDTENPSKTMEEVINAFTLKVGASKSFHENVDRASLLKLLPKSQDELQPRRMKDSWDSAVIPLGSNPSLRDRYITFLGGVRIGRLLEDMDIFAVWLCYKHILNPHQQPNLPSPYSVVTALVDRIDFKEVDELQGNRDIKLEGHVSWVGRSSIETTLYVSQEIDNKWKEITRAEFVMVARDPLNQGSAVVNPLLCETEDEKDVFHQGEVNRLSRKMLSEESLFVAPPNESEKTLVHNMFMKMANKDQFDFSPKNKPENSVWTEKTKLKNLILCHPQHRNRFKKIFGGFIMRQAFELAWASAFVYSKQRPTILHIDDIMFRRPVEIGSLLYFSSQVVFTSGRHMQISTKASVVDAVSQTHNLTNIFHFTFGVTQDVSTVLPLSYGEAMLYLDGRRRYQLSRGIRKFYAQGETVRDTK